MTAEMVRGYIPANCAVASMAEADWLLFAVLECPVSQSGAPSGVLAQAMAACADGAEPSQWPLRLATELHARLSAQSPPPGFGWGFFAAVAATRDRVVACHVGDLRVHLLVGREFTRVTRDHIVANEAADWLKKNYRDTDVSMHQTVATRALGQEPLRAESEEWPGANDLRLFVCDADYHRHRAPAAYLDEALGFTPPSVAAPVGLAGWFARAWI